MGNLIVIVLLYLFLVLWFIISVLSSERGNSKITAVLGFVYVSSGKISDDLDI